MRTRREYMRSAFRDLIDAGEVCFSEAKQMRRNLTDMTEDLLGGDEEECGFFSSYELSHSLTLAYPREMFEQIAEKAGIIHSGRDTLDLVRELHENGKI